MTIQSLQSEIDELSNRLLIATTELAIERTRRRDADQIIAALSGPDAFAPDRVIQLVARYIQLHGNPKPNR